MEEVYRQIISDLQRAKDVLSGDNSYFTTSEACSGILMRVYLNQQDYTKALEEADFIVNSGNYDLENLNEIFNQRDDTFEDVFAVQITSQDGDNDLITFYAGEEDGGRGDITITNQHILKYGISDERRSQLFYRDDNDVVRTGKWRDNASMDGNISIIRYAEVLLTRGECNARLGNISEAAFDLNQVRNRVGLGSVSNPSIDNILKERELELAFEGHLFRDIKRTERNFSNAIAFDDDRMVFPIPERELDVNHLLVQNPGY